jgi:hypothetical protein
LLSKATTQQPEREGGLVLGVVRLVGLLLTAPPLPVYPNLWAEEIPDVRARRKAEDETSASLKSK